MGDGFLGLIFILLILALYFLPFIIALIRDVRNKTSVFFLNLFLGWTIIGFFVLIFYASLTNASSNVSVADFVKRKSKSRTKQ
tara:strand:+ start:264 stop:512 length:249 start_codon:yes stop_codon:yes gene_type:complete